MTKPIETFQALLRELFQFDCADLDFGIYRIMNHKRDVIERFIVEDLPKAAAEALDSGAMAEQSRVAEELLEVRQQISKNLGTDAVDADGKLAETYRNTPLGEKYLELKENSGGSRGRDALEAEIPETFNYLIGLRVETRRVYNDDDRRYLVYRGWIDQRRVAVIWRETEGWGKAALVRDKEFAAERQLTTGADEVYVNGDSFIREAKALEPMFKRRMFAETQA